MSNKKEPIFPDGLIIKQNQNSPEWVIGKLSINVDELIPFLTTHQKKGWVNLEMKISKSGKPYCELDTWEPEKKSDRPKETVVEGSAKSANKTVATEAEETLPF